MGLCDGLPTFKKRAAVASAPVEPAAAVAEREISAVRQSFIDRAEKENQRYTAAVDSEYWFAVCFQNRAQKEAFLKALGLELYGDKYLDGGRVAHKFGVTLPAALATKPLKKDGPKVSGVGCKGA